MCLLSIKLNRLQMCYYTTSLIVQIFSKNSNEPRLLKYLHKDKKLARLNDMNTKLVNLRFKEKGK